MIKKSVTKGIILSLLLAFSVQTKMFAEENLDQLASMSIDELLTLELKTGSFLDLNLDKSPVTMTIIDKDQVRKSGSRHLGELLEIYVPGFQYMINKWNGDIWGMRGIAVDRNTKIIFLINGLKQNHESRDGAFSEINLGLLGDIERVEVLRGPSGLVYGSGAIAGVVNVVTKTPKKTSASISYGYGSWNSYDLQAMAHAQIKEDESLTLSFGARSSDGIGLRQSKIYGSESWPSDGAVAPTGVPSDGSAWSTPGNFKFGIDWKLQNFRLYSRFTRERFSTGQFFIVDPWPEVVGTPDEKSQEKIIDGKTVTYKDPIASAESWGTNRRSQIVDNLSIDGTYFFDIEKDQLKLEAAFIGVTNRLQTDFRPDYQVSGVDPKAGFIDQTIGEKRYLLSGQYLLKRVENLQSAFGLELRIDDLGKDLEGMNMHSGLVKHLNVSNVVYNNFALYTENYYNLNTSFGDFGFEGGIRLDKHTRTDSVFNPKLAVVYSPSKEHNIKAIFQTSSNNGSDDNYEYNWRHYSDSGQILKEPHLENASQKDSSKIPAVTEADLHSLKPETTMSYELASTHKIGDNFSFGPSISYNTVSNMFVWNQKLFRVINGGTFNFLSVEGDLKYQNDFMSLGLSHAFQRPVNTVSTIQTFKIPQTQVVADPTDPKKFLLEIIPNEFEEIKVDSIGDQITKDGNNFSNLATNVSKVYLTFTPPADILKFISFHTDMRLFWGLPGREKAYADDIAKKENYLGITSTPIVKWNASLHFDLPMDFMLSAYAYDILGQSDSLNAVRWQQSAEPAQKELYTVDQRSFALKLERNF